MVAPGMIQRPRWLAEIRAALKRSRVTALLGPHQSGKTTLARRIVPPDSARPAKAKAWARKARAERRASSGWKARSLRAQAIPRAKSASWRRVLASKTPSQYGAYTLMMESVVSQLARGSGFSQ
jgi:ABC-type glutathione transport system ATPase component